MLNISLYVFFKSTNYIIILYIIEHINQYQSIHLSTFLDGSAAGEGAFGKAVLAPRSGGDVDPCGCSVGIYHRVQQVMN